MSKDRNSKEELAERGIARLSLNVHPDVPGILEKLAGSKYKRGECIQNLIENEYFYFQTKKEQSFPDIEYDISNWVRLDAKVDLGIKPKLAEMSPNKKLQGTHLTSIVFHHVKSTANDHKSILNIKKKISCLTKETKSLIDSIEHFEDSASMEELAIGLEILSRLTIEAKDKLWRSM